MATERNNDWSAADEDASFAAIAVAAGTIVNTARSAEAIFKENASLAAEEIVSLALGSPNDRVRLDAAKYITDRVLGRVGDASSMGSDTGAPWDGVYAATIREPKAIERAAGATVHRAN